MPDTSPRNHARNGAALRPADIDLHQRLGIPPELLDAAGVRRVTSKEARDLLGVTRRGDLSGVVYPSLHPETSAVRNYRVRRDHPEIEGGKPKDKYISSVDPGTLYFPPDCRELLADVHTPIVFVEAEKSVLALTAAAARANRRLLAIATRGNWGWRGRIGKTTDASGARVDEKGPRPDLDRLQWRERDVTILCDANADKNPNTQAAARAFTAELESRGAQVRVAVVPRGEGINGPDDYGGTYGDAALFALIDEAAPPKRPPRSKKRERPKQGREVQFDEPEPWPEPVNGAELLEAIAKTFTTYIALPLTHAATALALWTLHAWAFDAWTMSPFLTITSPTKQCGKTTLLIVLGALVPRRLIASNVTATALFRTIEKYAPTLLIDEADTFIRSDTHELRGILNSGHTRTTAMVIRTVGDDHEPRTFSTWCPRAIALIGALPDTIADRSISIPLRRRLSSDQLTRLRQDRIDLECATLRRQARRWADDHHDALRDADPQVPPELQDRAADCWRPLVSIAEAVGGTWVTEACAAATVLSGAVDHADARVELLRDIAEILPAEDEDIASEDLLARLLALEHRPWATWRKDDKPLTARGLAALLDPFDVHPDQRRLSGGKVKRSYRRQAFDDAFARYLPGIASGKCDIANKDGPELAISMCDTPEGCHGSVSVTEAHISERCHTCHIDPDGASPKPTRTRGPAPPDSSVEQF